MDSHQKIKIFLKKMLPLLLSSAKAIEANKEIENEEFIKSLTSVCHKTKT